MAINPSWIKVYVKTLTSTLHQEMDAAERGLWNDFLLMAAQQDPEHGRFKVSANAGGEMDFEGLARLLNVHANIETAVAIISKTFEKNKKANRIRVARVKDGFWVTICNWHKYQRFTKQEVDIQKPQKSPVPDIHFTHKKRIEGNRREESKDGLAKGSTAMHIPLGEEGEKTQPTTAVASKLAALLMTEIKREHSAFREGRGQAEQWAKEIGLMIERDKQTPEDIEKVIKWSQGDDFWRGNILSAGKLREKYVQLCAHMDRGSAKKEKSVEEKEKAIQDDLGRSR